MNNPEEKVVAIIEPQAAGEDELAVQVTDIEVKAAELLVTNDAQYESAGKFGVMLREKMVDVTEFFTPMKKAAHAAHKQVCDREKQMLTPLKNAENCLKKSMGDYAYKKEQERKAIEAEARRLAQEEADRQLARAIQSEESGDAESAKSAMIDAEIADSVSRNVTIGDDKPKVKGLSSQKDWEIESIDTSKVPLDVAGVCIRPVDEAAVMRLIRASKGDIRIEGINYREIIKTSFRRS